MIKYTAVSLDKELLLKVDAAIKQDPSIVCRAEFVRRAVYNLLKELDKHGSEQSPKM
jgi:metal-responsive CopG/Arc/MetJ family transcriptional regulator